MKLLIYVVVPFWSFFADVNHQTITQNHQITTETIALTTLNGKWVFKFKTPRGERKYETTLKQNGNVAVGKIKEEALKINIKGDKVKFTTKRSMLIGTMVMNYKGTVKGNKMTGTYKVVKGFMASETEYTWKAIRTSK